MSALEHSIVRKDNDTNEHCDNYFGRFPEPMGMSDTYDKCKRQHLPHIPRQVAPRPQTLADASIEASTSKSLSVNTNLAAVAGSSSPLSSPSSPSSFTYGTRLSTNQEEKRDSWKLKSPSIFSNLLNKDSKQNKKAERNTTFSQEGERKKIKTQTYTQTCDPHTHTIKSKKKKKKKGPKLVRFDDNAEQMLAQRHRCDLATIVSAIQSTRDLYMAVKQRLPELNADPISGENNFGFDYVYCRGNEYGFDKDWHLIEQEMITTKELQAQIPLQQQTPKLSSQLQSHPLSQSLIISTSNLSQAESTKSLTDSQPLFSSGSGNIMLSPSSATATPGAHSFPYAGADNC
ncbi:hypothetical protein RFI_14127 [Reticulomyxa filosa]|uniref:Uncharacterized protein n=1 Tax=Reticulomyxa filosa TaxID=46433 RepID=X6NAW8_RETFI|nr:hypothetical protein RFI_14127 [Reticulomyxa filosa]|eukprot:ETO23058.1 hypothetical protein RFI_14127 [Reticulomyxa filosa]